MEFKKGTSVGVKYSCRQYSGRLNGKCGVVAIPFSAPNPIFGKVAVLIEEMVNPESKYGYFYFWPDDLYEFNGKPYCEKPKDSNNPFSIKNVYFNDPVTVVLWEDGTKTIVRSGKKDIYDPEKGLAMAIAKKALGNKGNYYDEFKKWLPKQEVKVTEKSPKEKQAVSKFASMVTSRCFTCGYRDLDFMADPCCRCSYDNGYKYYSPRKNCETCRYYSVDCLLEPCSSCLDSEEYCSEYEPAY